MSLILEALRKSEAERHRGLPPRLDSPVLRPTRRRQRLAPGLALLVLGAPAAGWFVYRGMAPDFAESQVDTSLAALLPPVTEGAVAPDAAPAQALAANDPGGNSQSLAAASAPAVAIATSANVVAASVTPASVATNQAAPGSNGTALIGGSFAASQDLPPPERMRPHTPSANSEQTQTARADTATAEKSMSVTPAPAAPAAVAASPQPVAPPAAMRPVPGAVAPAASTQVASAAPAPSAASLAKPLLPTAPPESQVPLIYDLSYEIRREMPKMDMSMHVYSGDRSARFIVLNGKRLQAGSTTGESEVQLVEIRRAGAVMAFRGSTFLLPRQGM